MQLICYLFNGYFFVEIFDGKEPRYFETLTKHHIKEIVEYCMYYRDVEGFNGNWIDSIDRNRWDHMITRLIEGIKKLTVKLVNFPINTRVFVISIFLMEIFLRYSEHFSGF